MEKISKNFNKGSVIKDARELIDLSLKGKSVYVETWRRTSPASFLINWPLREIIICIDKKRFYNIEKIKQ